MSLAFQWEKVEALDFALSFVVFYLKVGRYRQFTELMKIHVCEYSKSVVFLTFANLTLAFQRANLR